MSLFSVIRHWEKTQHTSISVPEQGQRYLDVRDISVIAGDNSV